MQCRVTDLNVWITALGLTANQSEKQTRPWLKRSLPQNMLGLLSQPKTVSFHTSWSGCETTGSLMRFFCFISLLDEHELPWIIAETSMKWFCYIEAVSMTEPCRMAKQPGINGYWKKPCLLYKYLNNLKGRWVFRINYPTLSKNERCNWLCELKASCWALCSINDLQTKTRHLLKAGSLWGYAG